MQLDGYVTHEDVRHLDFVEDRGGDVWRTRDATRVPIKTWIEREIFGRTKLFYGPLKTVLDESTIS